MVKIVKISMMALLGSSLAFAGASQMQKYEVKSGKITYEIKGSADIMGMVKTKTIGKKRVIFDEYGVQNLVEENKVEKKTTQGQTETTKSHTMVYMKDSILYQVDFSKKRIMRMQNPTAAMGALMGGEKSMKQTGEEMMKQMGGKKIGSDKVLGYTCDVWQIMGSVKQCMYKGIPLKVESDMMGMKSTEIASKIEFDISITKENFELPDFPIYDTQGNILDKNKLDSMDKKDEAKTMQVSEDMAVLGATVATAMQNAGVQKGETPTKAQEAEMKSAIMSAMLPQMKEQILGQESILLFGKECLGKADTLKEANICNQKANKMSDEEEEDFNEWNQKIKKEVLGFIEQGISQMDCIKKAQNMNEAQQCMPME